MQHFRIIRISFKGSPARKLSFDPASLTQLSQHQVAKYDGIAGRVGILAQFASLGGRSALATIHQTISKKNQTKSRVQSNAADPLRDEAGILSGRHAAVGAAMAGEQGFAGSLVGGLQIIIDGLASLIA
ncbi:hypothetical protein [Bradyrhizobium sp.]|jgi:hypothetical protein|uniref:hypothetical protein n=1 Tax=Bradyrhizobium sp. TaxID=376 RepID=UPI003C2153BB